MTETAHRNTGQGRWRRLGGALRVGLVFATLGIVLAVIGIFRGAVPLRPLSIFLALLISGGSWGIVSWAIATAAIDVDRDVTEATAGVDEETGTSAPG